MENPPRRISSTLGGALFEYNGIAANCSKNPVSQAAKIATVTPRIVRYPEPNDFGAERMTMLVEIAAVDGTVGWGEAIAMQPEACAATAKIVDGLAALVVGEDALDIDRHWRAMRAHCWWYGEGGIASMAIAAIDIALWDLKGKIVGAPLWRMLGGRAHEKLPACASMHINKETVAENVDEIVGHLRGGFRAAKLGFAKKGKSKVGRDRAHEIEFVRAARDAVGADTPLYIDIGNGVRWTREDALEAILRMEEIGIDWIEEPLHPSDWDGYRELKAKLRTPVAAGEREFTLAGYRRMLESGAVDIFGVDPARAEGISGFVRVARLLAAAGKTVNAHAWSTAVTTAASLALSAHCENAFVFELKPLPSPMQHDLVEEPIWHRDGWIAPSDAPGLGIEIRRAVVEKYEVR